jgi:hypothetical protein
MCASRTSKSHSNKYVYMLRGPDNRSGRPTWIYLNVQPDRVAGFLSDLKNKRLNPDLGMYGTIVNEVESRPYINTEEKKLITETADLLPEVGNIVYGYFNDADLFLQYVNIKDSPDMKYAGLNSLLEDPNTRWESIAESVCNNREDLPLLLLSDILRGIERSNHITESIIKCCIDTQNIAGLSFFAENQLEGKTLLKLFKYSLKHGNRDIIKTMAFLLSNVKSTQITHTTVHKITDILKQTFHSSNDYSQDDLEGKTRRMIKDIESRDGYLFFYNKYITREQFDWNNEEDDDEDEMEDLREEGDFED